MKKSVQITRRRFLAGTLLIPAIDVTRPLMAQDLPRLEESDPTAAALGYKHSVEDINTDMFPRRSTEAGGENQYCDNCVLYTGEVGEGNWGACALFPGKTVAAKGWCNVWAPRPA